MTITRRVSVLATVALLFLGWLTAPADATEQNPPPVADECHEQITTTEHESAKFTQTTTVGKITGTVYDVSPWTLWEPKSHVEWFAEPTTTEAQPHATWTDGLFRYVREWRLQPTGETRDVVTDGARIPCEPQPDPTTREESDTDCVSRLVTVRTYETPFVLEDFEWVPGEEVQTGETTTPATDEECPPTPVTIPAPYATNACNEAPLIYVTDVPGTTWKDGSLQSGLASPYAVHDATTTVTITYTASPGVVIDGPSEFVVEVPTEEPCPAPPVTEEPPAQASSTSAERPPMLPETGAAHTAALAALGCSLIGLGYSALRATRVRA